MVNFFWLVTCILATWAVNGAQHHQNSAPLQSPEPAPAPAPAGDCSSLIYNLADCLSFLSRSSGSNETKPQESCCSGVKLVLNADAECICEALKSCANLGVELNMTKAFTLPSACGISAPSFSSCKVSLPPGAPPSAAPVNPPSTAASPPDSQISPLPPSDNSPTPAAVSQVSAPSPASSGADTISTSHPVLLVVVIVASFLNIIVQAMS